MTDLQHGDRVRVGKREGEYRVSGGVAYVEFDHGSTTAQPSAYEYDLIAWGCTIEKIEPAEVLVEGAWYMDAIGTVAQRTSRNAKGDPEGCWSQKDFRCYHDTHMVRPLTRLIPASDVEAMVERIVERGAGRSANENRTVAREEAAKLLGGAS